MKPEEFLFNAQDHSYWLAGVRIPSYSEIAKAEGLTDYSGVSAQVMEASRNFGENGHRMLRLFVEDNLDEESLDENLVPYLNGFKKFCGLHKMSPLDGWVENPTYSVKWKYGVTPDWIGYIDDKLTVLEYKFTSIIMVSVAIQTAAQKVAFQERTQMKVDQRMVLQLLTDDFRVKRFDRASDEIGWLSAVNLFTLRKEYNLIKE